MVDVFELNVGGADVGGLVAAIVENLPGTAVLAFDRELRFSYAAGPALEEQGWDAGEVVGRLVEEVLPHAAAAVLLPRYQAALDGLPGSLELPATEAGPAYAVDITPLRAGDAVVGGMGVGPPVDSRPG